VKKLTENKEDQEKCRKSFGDECRHNMRSSDHLPSVSGVGSELGHHLRRNVITIRSMCRIFLNFISLATSAITFCTC